MAQVAGMSKTLGKKTVKNVRAYQEDLIKNLNTVHDEVVTLQSAWYGGKTSKKWYDDTRETYGKDVEYLSSLETMLQQMESYVSGYEKL